MGVDQRLRERETDVSNHFHYTLILVRSGGGQERSRSDHRSDSPGQPRNPTVMVPWTRGNCSAMLRAHATALHCHLSYSVQLADDVHTLYTALQIVMCIKCYCLASSAVNTKCSLYYCVDQQTIHSKSEQVCGKVCKSQQQYFAIKVPKSKV